jgi:ATP-dependent Clp protease adapter protein ClpS
MASAEKTLEELKVLVGQLNLTNRLPKKDKLLKQDYINVLDAYSKEQEELENKSKEKEKKEVKTALDPKKYRVLTPKDRAFQYVKVIVQDLDQSVNLEDDHQGRIHRMSWGNRHIGTITEHIPLDTNEPIPLRRGAIDVLKEVPMPRFKNSGKRDKLVISHSKRFKVLEFNDDWTIEEVKALKKKLAEDK